MVADTTKDIRVDIGWQVAEVPERCPNGHDWTKEGAYKAVRASAWYFDLICNYRGKHPQTGEFIYCKGTARAKRRREASGFLAPGAKSNQKFETQAHVLAAVHVKQGNAMFQGIAEMTGLTTGQVKSSLQKNLKGGYLTAEKRKVWPGGWGFAYSLTDLGKWWLAQAVQADLYGIRRYYAGGEANAAD